MPALLRVDGAGAIDVISLSDVAYTMVGLSNAPDADPGARRNPRAQTITDMAYVDGRLFVAGLSNEEFSSKLRSVPYPFSAVDDGTSVEIWHSAHGQFETHSPVYTFVPYEIGGEQNLIAGYLCTPLVKFPIDDLKPGSKVMGTTIAELGNRNRPLDMIVYEKDGKDFLLMSNTSRGVMKIPTEPFGRQSGLTEPVGGGGTAGVGYETIAQMKGVEQARSTRRPACHRHCPERVGSGESRGRGAAVAVTAVVPLAQCADASDRRRGLIARAVDRHGLRASSPLPSCGRRVAVVECRTRHNLHSTTCKFDSHVRMIRAPSRSR